ncbi:MAG: hypothetical protein AAB553_07455 [Patescibacteria group bacterium]
MKPIFCLIIVLLFLSFAKSASAEGNALVLSPSVIEINSQSPSEIYTPFSLENKSSSPIELTISYRPFKAADSEDGKVSLLDEPYNDSFIYLKKHFDVLNEEKTPVTSLRIGPQQKETFQLRMRIPEGIDAQDSYFSLIFLPKQAEISEEAQVDKLTYSQIKAGIVMNVLLSITDDTKKPQATLQQFSTPFYQEKAPVPFTVRIHNSGIHRITPKGVILIKNMFGQTVGRINLDQANILSNSTRAITNTQVAKEASSAAGLHVPTALWEENLLLGWYTASLSLAMSEDGPIINREIYFFAFPITWIIGLIVVLIAVSIIIIRVRKRLRQI